MGYATGIAWCDHTFNPWVGCTKVSAACDNCYAETLMDHRWHRVKWGAGQARSRTSAENWRQPGRWDTKAWADGVRRRVFCASLADVFDGEVDDQWRHDLFNVIACTDSLDWLLLTKRPALARRWYDAHGFPAHVWIGITAEDTASFLARWQYIDDIPRIRFVSAEPLLAPMLLPYRPDWLICGGESGQHVRPMALDWARDLRDQCAELKTPFFMKQMSGRTKAEREAIPDDLMIREFPE